MSSRLALFTYQQYEILDLIQVFGESDSQDTSCHKRMRGTKSEMTLFSPTGGKLDGWIRLMAFGWAATSLLRPSPVS